MRLRSVNLGIALTLTLAGTATASDGFPFIPQYDETSYEAAVLASASADGGAQFSPEDWVEPRAKFVGISPEDWVEQRAELADPTEITGAIPARIDDALADPYAFADPHPLADLDAPAQPQALTDPGFSPESFVIVDLAEAEPLPLQAISSFDLTVTADEIPTAPNWDTI
jgi:hypothetical protein